MKTFGAVLTLLGSILLLLVFIGGLISATNDNVATIAVSSALSGIGIVVAGIGLMHRPD